MFNFDFYNPTRIFFGKDRLDCIDQFVPADAVVLITYEAEVPLEAADRQGESRTSKQKNI
jgi:alcohol dehydrogenase YqhD (iron-dependent ADH family)